MKQADTETQLTEELDLLRPQVPCLSSACAARARADARFFAQSLDLLCIAGFDGYFKRLSPAWTSSLGWTLEELKARPFLDFVHPDDREITMAEVGNLSTGAATILFENRYRHRDNSYRWLRWGARPASGRQEIYATARDVTRQKRQEREILEIADREKERLGSELHDGLCQTLAGIAGLSSALSRRLATRSESEASAMAAEITKLLSESITQTRDMARGLAPVGLNEVGLAGALESMALNVQQLFRVPCTFECDGPIPRLRRDVDGHLFRIAQEAVNNAVAHARADRIEISLRCKDGKVLLNIRDNGVGVRDKAHNPDGIGLQTMAYRARLIGGAFEVRRRIRGGTAVTCAVPLLATPEAQEISDHVRHDI